MHDVARRTCRPARTKSPASQKAMHLAIVISSLAVLAPASALACENWVSPIHSVEAVRQPLGIALGSAGVLEGS